MSFAKITPIKKNIRPAIFGDYLNREHVLPGGVKLDAATFPGDDAIKVKLTAVANAAATSLTIVALKDTIPDDTLLDFGTNKFARVNDTVVAAGDVQITVDAIPTALAIGDTSYFLPVGATKRVAMGTPVYLSQATLEGSAATGAKWKWAGGGTTVADGDTVRILAYDVADLNSLNDGDLARKGTLVKVNYMYWDELDTTVKAKIRTDYEVTVGAPGQEVAAT